MWLTGLLLRRAPPVALFNRIQRVNSNLSIGGIGKSCVSFTRNSSIQPIDDMTDPFTAGKKAAAQQCVEEILSASSDKLRASTSSDNNKHPFVVGIGSGSTIVFAVEHLVQKIKNEKFQIVCIPTSFQAKDLILGNRLQLGTLEQYPELDVAIDGADDVDVNFNMIKGGGGCLLQEKIIASCAKDFFVICDDRKDSEVLCFGKYWKNGVPIEVLPMAYRSVMLKIEQQMGGKGQLRMAQRKAGPVVTDNGNFIVDWVFDKPQNWQDVDYKLHNIPGVLETGIFLNMANKVYFGTADGKVTVRNAPKK